jgi:uncharacterized protein (TIGR04222 family)
VHDFEGKLTLRETPTKLLGVLLTGTDRRLFAAAPLGPTPDVLERAVYEAASASNGASAADVSKVAAKACPTLRNQLADRRLVGRHPLVDPSRIVPAMVMWAVAGVGGVKIVVGLSRDKPVGFLVFAVIATVVVSLLFLSRRRVTPRGERLVEQLRKRRKNLGSIDPINSANIATNDIAYAVALFGASTLAVGEWEAYVQAIQSYHYAHGNSGGGCGGATGGCGTAGCGTGGCSSGCGGGGCGGGCGGCGG